LIEERWTQAAMCSSGRTVHWCLFSLIEERWVQAWPASGSAAGVILFSLVEERWVQALISKSENRQPRRLQLLSINEERWVQVVRSFGPSVALPRDGGGWVQTLGLLWTSEADPTCATRRAAMSQIRRTKTKSPAQKAWDTMRERYTEEEISDRQRDAAFKAWETRRENARKRKPANTRRSGSTVK
jgi:hypothetical protein